MITVVVLVLVVIVIVALLISTSSSRSSSRRKYFDVPRSENMSVWLGQAAVHDALDSTGCACVRGERAID